MSRAASQEPVDVAIVGGGIIGCAIAWELARRGASVALIERGSLAREASWASAGFIAPTTDRTTPPAKLDLITRSVLDYPNYLARLETETNAEIGWRQRGVLTVAHTEDELQELEAVADWQEGLGVNSEILDRARTTAMEPVLAPSTIGALFTPNAGSLVVHRLTREIANAAARAGAHIIEHTPATGVTSAGGRVTGLRTPDGVIPTGQVVLAAGAWTGELGAIIGQSIPTVPVKGQMLAIAEPPIMPSRPIARFRRGFLLPRIDGTVAIAATRERVGFDKRVTGHGIDWCLKLVEETAPSMLDGEVTASWAGLRPGSTDDLPIMGEVPGYDGLWVATGHYHTGVQMAPGTATVMADAILAGTRDPLLDAFSLTRFGGDET